MVKMSWNHLYFHRTSPLKFHPDQTYLLDPLTFAKDTVLIPSSGEHDGSDTSMKLVAGPQESLTAPKGL